MKRKLMGLLLALTMLTSLFFMGGCGPAADEPNDEPAPPVEEVEEVTIGFIGPTSGWATVYGEHVLRGARIALDEVDNKVLGRPVNLITEDTMGQVELMITKFDTLKERDGVRVILGPSLGGEGMAAVDWAARNPEVLVMPGFSAPQDLTMRKRTPNLVRAGWTANQVIFHFGQFVAQDLGHKRVIMVGQDYAYPWGQAAGFIRGFIENGGEEVYRIWHPIEMIDFSAIMVKLKEMSGEFDAVVYNGAGSAAISFWSHWERFGMADLYPQLLGGANVSDAALLPEMTPGFDGVYSSMHYVETLDNPANLKFRAIYREKYDEEPDAIALQGYDTMRILLKAIEAKGGTPEGEAEVLAMASYIKAMEITDSPRGGVLTFDEFGQIIQNVYIKRVQYVDGKLSNVIVRTIENVCQFGPYSELREEYMAMPADGRDSPPGTRAEYFAEITKYLGQEWVDMLQEYGGWPPGK